MTDDEIIAVVRAHKEGKKIECRYVMQPQTGWHEAHPELDWDFLSRDYRVAPEPRKPREWYLVTDNALIKSALPVTDTNRDTINGIHVREVIE